MLLELNDDPTHPISRAARVPLPQAFECVVVSSFIQTWVCFTSLYTTYLKCDANIFGEELLLLQAR
jgi:hypothetical protein